MKNQTRKTNSAVGRKKRHMRKKRAEVIWIPMTYEEAARLWDQLIASVGDANPPSVAAGDPDEEG
jgi:hypothetical protein